MSVDVLLIREGTKLAAADPLSAEIIAELKSGQTYTSTIRRPRNPSHHKKLWALISAVFESQNTFATKEDLLNALKMATGLFDTGLTVDRIPYAVPQSISFASMDQHRFQQWYDKAVEVILTKILPSANKAELDARVHDILNGYR